MKKLLIIVVIMTFLMSCERHDNTCDCDNPMEDLQWLEELKSSSLFSNCHCGMYIMQATYRKQTVFYVTPSYYLCDGYFPITLMDCEGNNLKTYYDLVGEEFSNEVTDRKEIYLCQD